MPSIGQQLRQARENRRLSIAQAVEVTRIRAQYLQALENDDIESLPSPVQGRGFLRSYADYLGLNIEALIAFQKTDAVEPGLITPQDVDQPAPAPQIKIPQPPPPPAEPEPELEPAPVVVKTHPEIKSLSQTIFQEIGQTLRSRRELLSLTLDEIERHTHVRKHNLKFIEDGAFDQLHSPVQARGMLHAYARFLDLDTDALLLRFADGLQIQREERHPHTPGRSSARRSWIPFWVRQFLSVDLIVGGGLIVILVTFAVWGAARILDIQAARQEAESAPSISDILLASPVATLDISLAPLPTDTPAIIFSDATATISAEILPTQGTFSVQVTVIVRERTFLRVIVDGKIKLDGRVAPGGAYTFEGNQQIEVLTGNAAAIQIIYNQRDMGTMGNAGEVGNLIYTGDAILDPTPTMTPTVTATAKVTVTPTPRITNTPTPTQQQ